MEKIILLRLSVAILVSLISNPLFANSVFIDTVRKCHSFANIDDRLTCYDTATGYKLEDTSLSNDGNVSSSENDHVNISGDQWEINVEKSALTGKSDVFMYVTSENLEPNSIGRPETGRLWIRCLDNTTAILITHGIYISDPHNVKYKLDDGPIQKKWMSALNGGGGVGLFSGGKSIPFIKTLLNRERMVAVLSGYSRNAELVFNISGLENKIDELATACNWKP